MQHCGMEVCSEGLEGAGQAPLPPPEGATQSWRECVWVSGREEARQGGEALAKQRGQGGNSLFCWEVVDGARTGPAVHWGDWWEMKQRAKGRERGGALHARPEGEVLIHWRQGGKDKVCKHQ